MVSVFLTDIVFLVLLGNYFLIRGISIIRTEKRLWLWMTVTMIRQNLVNMGETKPSFSTSC